MYIVGPEGEWWWLIHHVMSDSSFNSLSWAEPYSTVTLLMMIVLGPETTGLKLLKLATTDRGPGEPSISIPSPWQPSVPVYIQLVGRSYLWSIEVKQSFWAALLSSVDLSLIKSRVVAAAVVHPMCTTVVKVQVKDSFFELTLISGPTSSTAFITQGLRLGSEFGAKKKLFFSPCFCSHSCAGWQNQITYITPSPDILLVHCSAAAAFIKISRQVT